MTIAKRGIKVRSFIGILVGKPATSKVVAFKQSNECYFREIVYNIWIDWKAAKYHKKAFLDVRWYFCNIALQVDFPKKVASCHRICVYTSERFQTVAFHYFLLVNFSFLFVGQKIKISSIMYVLFLETSEWAEVMWLWTHLFSYWRSTVKAFFLYQYWELINLINNVWKAKW